jgi:GH35 family endo-1,4-beta-xylanase
MSRPVVSLIEQALSKTSAPLSINWIHRYCEHIAGHPVSRQTVKRELSRITNEEEFKFSWIKRVDKGLYQYVPSDKPSIENFNAEPQAKLSAVRIDDETVSFKIQIPAQFTKIQLLVEKI